MCRGNDEKEKKKRKRNINEKWRLCFLRWFFSTSTAAGLTFSLGSSARSSAPSLCSPRCSSRRCPARLATSFADSEAWSPGASPCCLQRQPPPPQWRPCNHHHPPSWISSPLTMDPNDRQKTRLDLTGNIPRFSYSEIQTRDSHSDRSSITTQPPFWRTTRAPFKVSTIFWLKNPPLVVEASTRSSTASIVANKERYRIEQSERKLIEARNARESTRMEGFETPFPKMRAASASQKLSPQIVALCLFDSADHACAFAP